MNILKQASAFFSISNDRYSQAQSALEDKFMAHVAEFGLSFGTQEEYTFRLQQFAIKDEFIEKTNSEQSSYWLAHNKFSTWTEAEYKRLLKRLPSNQDESKVVELPLEDTPDAVDWREHGAVNDVQN